jgi:hypothetical protein
LPIDNSKTKNNKNPSKKSMWGDIQTNKKQNKQTDKQTNKKFQVQEQ